MWACTTATKHINVLNNIPLNCRKNIILIFVVLTVSLLKLYKRVQIQSVTRNSIVLVVIYNLQTVTTITLKEVVHTEDF